MVCSATYCFQQPSQSCYIYVAASCSLSLSTKHCRCRAAPSRTHSGSGSTGLGYTCALSADGIGWRPLRTAQPCFQPCLHAVASPLTQSAAAVVCACVPTPQRGGSAICQSRHYGRQPVLHGVSPGVLPVQHNCSPTSLERTDTRRELLCAAQFSDPRLLWPHVR